MLKPELHSFRLATRLMIPFLIELQSAYKDERLNVHETRAQVYNHSSELRFAITQRLKC